jgi:hypothetical protein
MIKDYDILIFVETKTDEFDEINLPGGYSYHVKHPIFFKRKSGGIIIIYKDTISKCLTFPTSNSEFVQWVEIANECSKFTKLLIGCVYIPPETTKYTSDNAFNEIENELMSFSQNTKHITLVGDFNSRTSNLTNYILPDEELINEILDIVDDDVIESMFSHQILQHHDIPLDRYSEDRARPNTYEMNLIKLCKRCSLFIASD